MRKAILFLMTSLLIPLICSAQRYSDQVIEIKGIPEFGILLDQGWKFKAGDNPDWALPDFPDDTWESLNPTPDVRDVKPLWDAGRGWLRIRFKLASTLALQSIVMQVQQSTATEFYFDGQLIHQAGHFGENSSDVKAKRIFANELLNLPLRPGQVHTLAVRIGVQKNMLYATWAAYFTTALTIRVFDAYQGSLFVKNSDNFKSEMFRHGIFFILTLLHIALFLSNKNKKSNLYFSIVMFLFFFSGLLNLNWTNSVEVQFLTLYFVILSTFLGYAFYYLAIQEILNIKNKKHVIFLFVPIGLIILLSSQIFYQYGFIILTLPYLILNIEFIRISTIAVIRRKRGAALILGGGIAVFLFILLFVFASMNVIPQGDYFFWGHIYYFCALVFLPVTVSMYLAMEFGFLGKALSKKLREVKFLSEKNQKQAEEKRKLLESQNETLEQKVSERTAALNQSLEDLKSTQSQLIQSEKMASLGELTAGIAHEIQNPLNFVNNFSEVSNELIDEMKDEFKKGDIDEGFAIADDIKQNLEKITHHGKRADAIVKGMLEHSRAGKGEKAPTDINALADEFLRLSYQSFLAKDPNFKVELQTNLDPDLPKISVIPQDIGKVLHNLYSNAHYAVSSVENPVVTVTTPLEGGSASPENSGGVKISVSDNGPGIPDAIKDKIFQPFFTTKPTGQGTGLGLSLSYDIVKAHGGELKVETNTGEGLPAGKTFTEFTIILPL